MKGHIAVFELNILLLILHPNTLFQLHNQYYYMCISLFLLPTFILIKPIIPIIINIIDTIWLILNPKKYKLSVLNPSMKNLPIPYKIKYIDNNIPLRLYLSFFLIINNIIKIIKIIN